MRDLMSLVPGRKMAFIVFVGIHFLWGECIHAAKPRGGDVIHTEENLCASNHHQVIQNPKFLSDKGLEQKFVQLELQEEEEDLLSDADSDYAPSDSESDSETYDTDSEDDSDYEYSPPTIKANLSRFQGKKSYLLHRGHHYLKNRFSKEERSEDVRSDPVGQPLLSGAVLEIGDVERVRNEVRSLNDLKSLTVNGFTFPTGRDAFQHLYSNNYNAFFSYLHQPNLRNRPFNPVLKDITFSSNPFVSFADEVHHPAKYGYGLKNYGDESDVLTPSYDMDGKPRL